MNVLLEILIALATGAGLRAVLPRGVVLTSVLDQEPRLVPHGVV